MVNYLSERTTVPAPSRYLVTTDLSICRNPAQPASSRSKAVDSKAAHRFQTGRCIGCVSSVSDKPDRLYYYEDCPVLPDRKKQSL